MEVVIVALAGFLIIGIAWSFMHVATHEGADMKMRHERLLRELSRHD